MVKNREDVTQTQAAASGSGRTGCVTTWGRERSRPLVFFAAETAAEEAEQFPHNLIKVKAQVCGEIDCPTKHSDHNKPCKAHKGQAFIH